MKPFVRTKIIKGHEYLYEVTPYLDPDTGKWKQKNRYLGKNVDGSPVRREKKEKADYVIDVGQYIPLYWAIREYRIMESLLSGCSPDEAATLVMLAINRLVHPCPLSSLETWLSGSCIPRLFPGYQSDPDIILEALENVHDSPVAPMFSKMFPMINRLSDQRALMTLKNISSMYGSARSGVKPALDMLEREMVICIQYDPNARLPVGFEIFPFQRAAIENSIHKICQGQIPNGVLVPHWDFMTPSLLPRLKRNECSYVVRVDLSYDPLFSQISTPGTQVYHQANIRHYHGQACYIRPIIPDIHGDSCDGYLLHNIKKEQTDRLAFHKNIQNIREYLISLCTEPGMTCDLLTEACGSFQEFFFIAQGDDSCTIMRNNDAIQSSLNRFGRDCVLHQGISSWEECFSLVDIRESLEDELFQMINTFERDYAHLRMDRIRSGIFFVAYLALLIRHLVTTRIRAVNIPQVISYESLLTELTPIHMVRFDSSTLLPKRLKRHQKTLLSYFGGIPPVL